MLVRCWIARAVCLRWSRWSWNWAARILSSFWNLPTSLSLSTGRLYESYYFIITLCNYLFFIYYF
jgi:hypothetical protein